MNIELTINNATKTWLNRYLWLFCNSALTLEEMALSGLKQWIIYTMNILEQWNNIHDEMVQMTLYYNSLKNRLQLLSRV